MPQGEAVWPPPAAETFEKVQGLFRKKAAARGSALRRRKVRFSPFPPNGENYERFLAPPLPTQTASLSLRGAPKTAAGWQVARLRAERCFPDAHVAGKNGSHLISPLRRRNSARFFDKLCRQGGPFGLPWRRFLRKAQGGGPVARHENCKVFALPSMQEANFKLK